MNNYVSPDIFDPRNGDRLDPKKIDILLQKGPKREYMEHGSYDKFSRRFSLLSFNRIRSNDMLVKINYEDFIQGTQDR